MTIIGKRVDYALFHRDLAPIAERMRAGTATSADVASARRIAVEVGLWSELAREFPKHFGDGYEVAPAYAAKPPPTALPTIVPLSSFEAAVGKTIVVRMNRADGGSSLVVGKLHSVHLRHEGVGVLRFSSFDPELAARLAAKDDVPWAPMQGDVVIGYGTMHSAASFSPVEGDTRIGAASAKRGRVDVRRTAEQIAAGTFTPKVDLQPLIDVIDGKADRGQIGDHYLAALKIERNALATAIIQPVLERIESFLATERPPPDPFNRRPIDHLQGWMFERVDAEVTKVLTDIAAAPESPLGRAFARLSAVLDLESQAVPHPKIASARTNPLAMIKVAAKTPMSIPFAMMRAVSHSSLLGHAPSGDEVKTLLHSAIPSLMRVASSDMEVFIKHLETWMVPGLSLSTFKAEALELNDKGLELNADTLQQIAKNSGVHLDTILAGTTGCPARLTVSGVNRLPKIMELVAKQLGDATG